MNNAILFYFDMNVSDVKKINGNYYFNYFNSDYVVHLYKRDVYEIMEIYYVNLELLNNGFAGYEIMLTKNNDIVFLYEKEYYVLMRLPSIKNRMITFDDVLGFDFAYNTKINKLDKSNWANNWSFKVDFIENQFEQVRGKYNIISSSIDYFIGIWENAISYYNDNVKGNGRKCICHNRVYYDMDLLEFVNPLNFVVDYKERDVGEYLKSYVMNNNFTKESVDKFLVCNSKESVCTLISRLLFPSYYFDVYEDIVVNNRSEDDISDIVLRRNNVIYVVYLLSLKYSNFNVPIINWIKKEISLQGLI